VVKDRDSDDAVPSKLKSDTALPWRVKVAVKDVIVDAVEMLMVHAAVASCELDSCEGAGHSAGTDVRCVTTPSGDPGVVWLLCTIK
jgi:hypothetical protein